MPSCCFAKMTLCNLLFYQKWDYTNMPFCQNWHYAILQFYNFPKWHYAVMPKWHCVTLMFCKYCIIPTCHLTKIALLTCHLPKCHYKTSHFTTNSIMQSGYFAKMALYYGKLVYLELSQTKYPRPLSGRSWEPTFSPNLIRCR